MVITTLLPARGGIPDGSLRTTLTKTSTAPRAGTGDRPTRMPATSLEKRAIHTRNIWRAYIITPVGSEPLYQGPRTCEGTFILAADAAWRKVNPDPSKSKPVVDILHIISRSCPPHSARVPAPRRATRRRRRPADGGGRLLSPARGDAPGEEETSGLGSNGPVPQADLGHGYPWGVSPPWLLYWRPGWLISHTPFSSIILLVYIYTRPTSTALLDTGVSRLPAFYTGALGHIRRAHGYRGSHTPFPQEPGLLPMQGSL